VERTNTFAVRPLSDNGEQLLRDLLDASAALWNEVNYQRLMRYNDEDGFEDEDEDVWDADTGQLETHWSVETNAKTHNFWAFKQFTERLVCTAEEYGTVFRSKSGRKRGPVKGAHSAVRQTERHGIGTRSLVSVDSRVTPTLRRQKRS